MPQPVETMPQPTFEPVDLTELQNFGVLMAANELVFWPLGLALTWDHDKATGVASNLHIREWSTHESIELGPDDQIGIERRRQFAIWAAKRLALVQQADAEQQAKLAKYIEEHPNG